MQLNKSRAFGESWVLASVLANRIQMCTKENASENSRRFCCFLFFLHSTWGERGKSFFSRHTIFPIFYSFSILSAFYSFFLLFLLLTLGTVLEHLFDQYSRNSFLHSFLSFHERTFPLSSTRSCITNINRMRGLTDFARTIPIGKKATLLEIFDWLTPFSLPSVASFSRSQSSFGFFVFGPVIQRSIFTDSAAAAIKKISVYVQDSGLCRYERLCAVGQNSRCFMIMLGLD